MPIAKLLIHMIIKLHGEELKKVVSFCLLIKNIIYHTLFLYKKNVISHNLIDNVTDSL